MFAKKYIIIIALCLSFLLIVSCVNYYSKSDYDSVQNKKTLNIFINELPKTSSLGLTKLNVLKLNSVWYINQKRYEAVKNTSFSPYAETVHWQINLSFLNLCGYCEDYFVYSYSGDCQRDVLVVQQANKLFLLASFDVLNPERYSFKDFSIANSFEFENQADLENIWQDHLSKKYNISYLVYEDKPNEMVLCLKKYPELQYTINYIEHLNHFYSRLHYGFDKTGDG